MMKVIVNKELCIGCGACVSTCDKVFKLGDDGKSEVIENADLDQNAQCIEQAADACPAQAIKVEKE